MKKGIIGSMMKSQSVLWYAIAFSLLLPAGSAMAQSSWKFVDLDVDFTKSTASGTVSNVSGILYGKDSVNGTVWGNNRDGKINTGSKQGKFLSTNDKPLLANIENGEPIYLFAVVTGVDEPTVLGVKEENASTLAAVKSVVNATFPDLLFGGETPQSMYSEVSPTSVTGIANDDPNGLDLDKDNTLLCTWKISGLVVKATQPDSKFSTDGLEALMSIAGSTQLDGATGVTNLIGVETTGSGAKHSSPQISSIMISGGTDTTTKPLYDSNLTAFYQGTGDTASFLPLDPNTPITTEIPFQFRGGDIVEVKAVIKPNATADGEPDAYFGSGGTDPYQLTKDHGDESAAGGKVANQVNLSKSGSVALTKGATSELTVTMKLKNRTGNWADLSKVYAYTQMSGSDVILYVTSQVINKPLDFSTLGAQEQLIVDIAVADDVSATTSTTFGDSSSEPFWADTLPVFVSKVSLTPEEDNFHDKIGPSYATNSDNDQAILEVDINRSSESLLNGSWLKMALSADATDNSWDSWAKNESRVTIDEITNGSATGYANGFTSSATEFVNDALTVGGGNEPGVRANIKIQSSMFPVTQRDPGAGIIVSVSDDARNPAILYALNDQSRTSVTSRSQAGDSLLGFVDTSKKQVAISSESPLIASIVGPATVVVDALAPLVQEVKFAVTGYPSGSGLGSDAFNLLKQSPEILNAPINVGAGDVKYVTRAVAKLGVSQASETQNGSKMQVVVKFKPTTDSAVDPDNVLPSGTSVNNYIKQQFVYNLTSSKVGYVTTSDKKLVTNHWNFVEGKLDSANDVAYATWESKNEITVNTPVSFEDAQLSARLHDGTFNFSSSSLSNPVVVDINRATTTLVNYPGFNNQIATPRLTQATPEYARTVVLVTSTDNRSLTDLESGINYDPYADSVLDLAQSGSIAGFKNSVPTFVQNSNLFVEAGDLIIVSTSFKEPFGANAEPGMSNTGNVAPYIGVDFGETVGDNVIGGLSTFPYNVKDNESYFNTFKTITADFSDFVEGANNVLPDVTKTVDLSGGATDLNQAADTSITYATWYYLIPRSGADLNTVLSSGDVRLVTFTSRDISGNINKLHTPVALADFQEPEPAIVSLKISNNLVSDLLVQDEAHGTNLVSSSIDNATIVGTSTMQLVVRIGGGTADDEFPGQGGGGPFASSNFITADLSAFGVSSTQTPDTVEFIPDVSDPGLAGETTVTFATFNISADDVDNTSAKHTNGAANAQGTVNVVSKSGAENSVKTVKLDVDGKNPTATGNQRVIVELQHPAIPDDPTDDGFLRAGSIYVVTAEFNTDLNDRRARNMDFSADLSKFTNNTERQAPNNVYYESQGSVTVPANTVLAVWQNAVSDPPPATSGNITFYATDASKLTASSTSKNQFFIASGQVNIFDVVMDASREINYVTDTIGIRRDFDGDVTTNDWIVQKLGSTINRNDTQTGVGGNTIGPKTTVKNEDKLRVVTSFRLTDPVFTSPQKVQFDFTKFGGDVVEINPTDNEDMFEIGSQVIRATYEASVGNAASVAEATVPVTVFDKAGNTAVSYAPAFRIDNTPPTLTSVDVKYFEKNNQQTDSELNPKSASATIQIVVDYPSASQTIGFPGSLWGAAYDAHGNNNGIADRSLVSIDGTKFNPVTFDGGNAESIIPSNWKLTGAGPTIWDTSSAAEIKASTNTKLTAFFGFEPSLNPEGVGVGSKPRPGIVFGNSSVASANFVVSASDHVGNVTDVTTSPVQLDSDKPKIENVVLDVVTDSQEAGVDYLPAVYAAKDEIVRPTRVKVGTVMKATYKIKDAPVKGDKIFTALRAQQGTSIPGQLGTLEHNFDSNDFSLNLSNATLVSSSQRDDHLFADVLPTDTYAVFEVTFTVGSDTSNKNIQNKAINTDPTFPLDVNNPLALNSYYDGSEAASIAVWATDTASNKQTEVRSSVAKDGSPIEIDTQGPRVMQQIVIAVNDGEVDGVDAADVGSIAPAQQTLSNQLANAAPSQWIVWAATMVVDGSEAANLNVPTLNWRAKLNDNVDDSDPGNDITRLEGSSMDKTYSEFIIESPTRSVVFVRNAVKVVSNPLSKQPIQIDISAQDIFGNSIMNSPKTIPVAIGAKGPSVFSLLVKVDGVPDTEGASKLGIGSNNVDGSSSTVELKPGNTIEVQATITTDEDGNIPEKIFADFSALFPHALRKSVDRVVPTTLVQEEGDLVVATWKNILYNFKQGNNDNIAFADTSLIGEQNVIPTGAILETTGVVTSNGIADSGDSAKDVSNAMLKQLVGLPAIQVQPDANPNKEAKITVFIDDVDDRFGQETTESFKFAVDSQRPTVDTNVKVTQRGNPPDFTFISGDRDGFPLAPNLTDDTDEITGVPNRVTGGDTLQIVYTITNPNIEDNGNDRFRYIMGDDANKIFTLNTSNMDTAASQLIKSITADLSGFLTDEGSDSVALANADQVSVEVEAGKPSVITATFSLVVSDDARVSPVRSPELANQLPAAKFIVRVTPSLMDDAMNTPFNTLWTQVLDSSSDVSVDNVGPFFRSITVRLQEGNASDSTGDPINEGSVVSAGSVVDPGSKLAIEVSINENVDDPLDIFSNSNYGNIQLIANGFTVAESERLITDTQQSGSLISGQYVVTIPGTDNGKPFTSFDFVVNASDTVGNVQSKQTAAFALDATPIITVSSDGAELELPQTFRVNAEDSITFDSMANDPGLLSSLEWIVSPEPFDGFQAVTDQGTFKVTSEDGSSELALSLTVTPALNNTNQQMTAKTVAVDDSAVSATSELITVSFNQPALFADAFKGTETTSAGAVLETTAEESVAGWNKIAGSDIREVTVPEGSILQLNVLATDANASDSVELGASIDTEIPSDAFEAWIDDTQLGDSAFSQSFAGGVADATFTFKPLYTAVKGETQNARFSIDLTAVGGTDSDGNAIAADTSTITVNIVPAAATPELEVVSIVSGDEDQSATLGDSVDVAEDDTLVITLKATDPGDEPLSFTQTTTPAPLSALNVVDEGTSVKTVTYTYKPGFNEADLPGRPKDADPFVLDVTFTNGTWNVSGQKTVEIENTNQAPQIVATAGLAQDDQRPILDNGAVIANPGDIVFFTFTATDPDGNNVFTITQITDQNGIPIDESLISSTSQSSAGETVVKLQVTVPSDAETGIIVQLSATDTDQQSTVTLNIRLETAVPVDEIDEVVLAQGIEGEGKLQFKNFDPRSGTPVGANVRPALNGITNVSVIGGGIDRGVYVAVGDVDMDGDPDMVLTNTTITNNSILPNRFIVRDMRTGEPVLTPEHAFPIQSPNPIDYEYGDMPVAVGNFIGTATPQIAVAQGFGGTSLVRLFMYNHKAQGAGFEWKLVGQFQGLAGPALNQNAEGFISIAAGDVDNDGIDELIVGQGNSASSRTLFRVIDVQQTEGEGFAGAEVHNSLDDDGNPITENGNPVPLQKAFAAFFPTYQGNGGANYAIGDINGDGINEIVAASNGDDTGNATRPNGDVINSHLTVIIPTVVERPDGTKAVDGFSYASSAPGTQNIVTAFNVAQNPSGSVNLILAEIDGIEANGMEVVVGTGSITEITGDDTVEVAGHSFTTPGGREITTFRTVVNDMVVGSKENTAAPQSKFRIIKPEFDGTAISKTNGVLVGGVNFGRQIGIDALLGVANPASGAIFLGAGNSHPTNE